MNSIKPKNVLLNSGSLKIEKLDESLMNKEEASDSIDDSNNVLRNFELNVKINKAISKHLSLNRKNLHGLNASSGVAAPDADQIQKKEYITDSSSMLIERNKKIFKKENHFYPKVANAKMHPLVASFFKLTNESIIARYKQLNPSVNVDMLRKLLAYNPKYFKWAGADLFNVFDNFGKRQMMIIETNSCPSGQKSMPPADENQKFAGYKILLEALFDDLLSNRVEAKCAGDLAVVFDKNPTENSAYSIVLAELSNEKVWLVENLDDENVTDQNRILKWEDGVMHVRDTKTNKWHPIRACLRYITQKPWKKIPLNTKTIVLNPIISCLAGGRNKIMAAYAYKQFNLEQSKLNSGLSIRLPHSVINVNKKDIPALLVNDSKLDGKAVVKVPYSNCGQGVYTIINKSELDEFMNINHKYDKFIVQSLIGDYTWSSIHNRSQEIKNYYHIGTIPDAQQNVYVYDLRMIVTSNKNGFCPVSMNSRRARKPLIKNLNPNETTNQNDDDPVFSSWDMLGTNLSIKIDTNMWDTESERLLTMDHNDFNILGLGLDDLIDAYIQTVQSVISIDRLCIELLESPSLDSLVNEENEKMFGKFNFELFKQLNPDDSLLNEIKFY
jgi:hypothetical protein